MRTRIPLMAATLGLSCGAALATEYGTVVSSTAVTAQVAVPVSQCQDQQQFVQPRTSGGGAVLGAVIGAAVGNSLGAGAGRAAATGIGAVAGAALGDQAEASGLPPGAVTVRHCTTATRYENRVVGYDVVYDYQGQRYSTRLAQDPGDRIALNVTVTPVDRPVAVAPSVSPPPVIYRQPVYAPPPVIYGPPPGYAYYGSYGYDGYYGYPRAVITVVPRVVIGGTWGHSGRHGRW